MTIVTALDGIVKWLDENVCKNLWFKKPPDDREPDDAGYEYELVHPKAFPLFVPPMDLLPPNVSVNSPSICVTLIQGTDDVTMKDRTLDVSLSFCIWNPGDYTSDWLNPDGTEHTGKGAGGWRDLWNFIDYTANKIASATYIGGMEVCRNVRWEYGPYRQASMDTRYAQEQISDYPLWFGFYRFRLRCTLLPNNPEIESIIGR